MAKIERVLQAVVSTPWAIMPEKLDAILEVLQLRADGVELTETERAAAGLNAGGGTARVEGKVAVLPLFGVVARRMNMMMAMSGGVSLEMFRKQLDAALQDPDVKAIIIQVDSPGGEVAGVPEMADYIYSQRGTKRMIAVADTLAASAAYWLATAANEVVVTPSGYVGSVGVFTIHVDESAANEAQGVKYTVIRAGKYKAEGLPMEPLPEEAKAYMQAQADMVYEVFVKALATQRDVSVKTVRDDFGQGRVVDAEAAKARGMVDRVATFEDVLASLGVGAVGVGNVRRSRALAAARERELKLQERGLY